MPNRLTLPIAVTADGSLAALPQDHPLEVARSVGLLLSTRPWIIDPTAISARSGGAAPS